MLDTLSDSDDMLMYETFLFIYTYLDRLYSNMLKDGYLC